MGQSAVPHRSGIDRPAAGLLLIGAAAAFLYCNFLLDWVLRGFEGMGAVVSDLEAPGEPNATLLRVTDVICAALVLALLPWVRSGLPAGRWRELCIAATAVFALGASFAAVVATPCGPGERCDAEADQLATTLHDTGSSVSDTALYVGVAAAWFATRSVTATWFHRTASWSFWVGGVATSAVFGYVRWADPSSWTVGAVQRVHIVGIAVWIVALSVFAATEGQAVRRSRRALVAMER